MSDDLTFSSKKFWSLVGMKVIRNLASVKYQWLLLLYIPTIWGMFNFKPGTQEPWISDTVGMGFLGSGFITLAVSRLIAKTKLTEDKEDKEDLDTDS